VTTVKLTTITKRPSTLLAVCAPVPAAHASLVTAAAQTVATGGLTAGTSQVQAQRIRVEGRIASAYGFEAKDSVKAAMGLGDVRGVPPRGRPV
jgi:hypothetical protein